ncbi:MAG: 5,10-methylenetetrahydrofolate reductase [Deltaproteobacteria bacterium]|nr:MAG: 5,10-methylenetetrahydrofolate reductase [Deltaproteobacteria bacterium]
MSLKSKFETGEFAILVEAEPPKGVDISPMLAHAEPLKDKVDAFVVPEMSNAILRMSALGAAIALQNKGLETAMQISCRDRNQLALQADLLAAAACDINNIIAVPGDDPKIGDHPQTKAVNELNLVELLQAAKKLQQGNDLGGNPLSSAPSFLLGTVANAGMTGKNLTKEIDNSKECLTAGAQFIITPPLFDIAAIEPYLRQIDHKTTKIIPTVLLLKSVGMARYIKQTQDNVVIPDGIIDRIRKASDKAKTCTDIAKEMLESLKQKGFAGAMISTVGWEHKLMEILKP